MRENVSRDGSVHCYPEQKHCSSASQQTVRSNRSLLSKWPRVLSRQHFITHNTKKHFLVSAALTILSTDATSHPKAFHSRRPVNSLPHSHFSVHPPAVNIRCLFPNWLKQVAPSLSLTQQILNDRCDEVLKNFWSGEVGFYFMTMLCDLR